MVQCYRPGDFKKYFKENMDDLGMLYPKEYFTSLAVSLTTATGILVALDTAGKTATMGELIGATYTLEKLKVVAGLQAAYYAGTVIGSMGVAAWRSGQCGAHIADMFSTDNIHNRNSMSRFIADNNLQFPDSQLFYIYHPEILDKSNKRRSSFGARMADRNG